MNFLLSFRSHFLPLFLNPILRGYFGPPFCMGQGKIDMPPINQKVLNLHS